MYPANPNNSVLCPRCGQAHGEPVKFTWWGGIIGPKLIHHVRCPACKYEYNGKTGQSNQKAIIAYIVIGTIIGILILLLLNWPR